MGIGVLNLNLRLGSGGSSKWVLWKHIKGVHSATFFQLFNNHCSGRQSLLLTRWKANNLEQKKYGSC